MHLDIIKLKNKIDTLEELYHSVIEKLRLGDSEHYSKAVKEYTDLKKELLLQLYEKPIHLADTQHFSDVRKLLQRLTLHGDPFIPDKKSFGENFNEIIDALNLDLSIKFEWKEIENIASKEFHSWFSGEEYVMAMFKSQMLILKAGRLPKFLNGFVNQIRISFAFQLYSASYALCRTILEIAVRDLYESNKLHKYDTEHAKHTVEYFKEKNKDNKKATIDKFDPDLYDRIEILSKLSQFSEFKGKMHDVRMDANSLIHANRMANAEEAKHMIQNTFGLIHNLYEAN